MKARRLAVLLIPVLVVALVGLVGQRPHAAVRGRGQPARPLAVSRPVLVQGSRGRRSGACRRC